MEDPRKGARPQKHPGLGILRDQLRDGGADLARELVRRLAPHPRNECDFADPFRARLPHGKAAQRRPATEKGPDAGLDVMRSRVRSHRRMMRRTRLSLCSVPHGGGARAGPQWTMLQFTPQMRTLARALKDFGGEVALAKALAVPATDLARWLGGQEGVPVGVYVKALDLVAGGARKKSRDRAAGR